MKLTPFAKLFITVVVVAVVGYAAYYYKGAEIRQWAVGEKPAGAPASQDVTRGDFEALGGAPADPATSRRHPRDLQDQRRHGPLEPGVHVAVREGDRHPV